MSPASITKIRNDREARARRRLELAKQLRDDPKATNIALAKVLNVTRNTITEDRKAIMEQMTKSTLTETELLRADMVKEFEALKAEVEKHRKDGKLSLQAVDRLLDITKAIVELTGVRKPVNEKLAVTHRAPIRFETVIVNTRNGVERPALGTPGSGVTFPQSIKPDGDCVWDDHRGWVFRTPPVIDIKEPLALGAGDEQS